jgi:hypothetical protein
MSRAFFAPFDKTSHVLLLLILTKTVARNWGQAVTLLDTLYLIPSSLAMRSRKYVLTICIVTSFENGDVRQLRKAHLDRKISAMLDSPDVA